MYANVELVYGDRGFLDENILNDKGNRIFNCNVSPSLFSPQTNGCKKPLVATWAMAAMGGIVELARIIRSPEILSALLASYSLLCSSTSLGYSGMR
jgi:hypothetical protein